MITQITSNHRDSLDNFEEKRASVRFSSDELPRLKENERKQLLETFDSRPSLQRAASYVKQRRELEALRAARDAVGCQVSSHYCAWCLCE